MVRGVKRKQTRVGGSGRGKGEMGGGEGGVVIQLTSFFF